MTCSCWRNPIVQLLYVGIDGDPADARMVGNDSCGGVCDRAGLDQQLLHPVIGTERLALDNADGGDLAAHFRSDRVNRLALDRRIEDLEVLRDRWGRPC